MKTFEWDGEVFIWQNDLGKWTLRELRAVELQFGTTAESLKAMFQHAAIFWVSVKRSRPSFSLREVTELSVEELKAIEVQDGPDRRRQTQTRRGRRPEKFPDGGLLAECDAIVEENWPYVLRFYRVKPSELEDLALNEVKALCDLARAEWKSGQEAD